MSRFVGWDKDKAGTETCVIAGHQRLDVSRSVPLSVRVRTWSIRYAVAVWHRICCFFTNRRLITWLTADSASPQPAWQLSEVRMRGMQAP